MAVAKIRHQSRRLSNRHYREPAEGRAEIWQRQHLELVRSRKCTFGERLLRRRDLITTHLENRKGPPERGSFFWLLASTQSRIEKGPRFRPVEKLIAECKLPAGRKTNSQRRQRDL